MSDSTLAARKSAAPEPERPDVDVATRSADASAPAVPVPLAGLLLGRGAQRRMTVGAAADPAELEADAMAARVVAYLGGGAAAPAAEVHAHGPGCGHDGPARHVAGGTGPAADVHTHGPGCGHGLVARHADPGVHSHGQEGGIGLAGGDLDTGAESTLQSARGGGSPLPEAARRSMESAMGFDFSAVRVHSGPTAAGLSRSMNADAFTLGGDVFFRDGVPDAATPDGARLLAHELTHTVQQGVASPLGTGERVSRSYGGCCINRHISAEHRMLGDLKPQEMKEFGQIKDLAALSPTKRKKVGKAIAHTIMQELDRLRVWQEHPPAGGTKADIANWKGSLAHTPGAGAVTDPSWDVHIVEIPSTAEPDRPPELVTYGELNTLADFYGSVDELKGAKYDDRHQTVQSVRRQSWEYLWKMWNDLPQDIRTDPGTVAAFNRNWEAQDDQDEGFGEVFEDSYNISGTTGEVNQMLVNRKGAYGKVDNYKSTLARNACHFAPESWHSWAHYHDLAIDLARQSHAARMHHAFDKADELFNEAMLNNGFGDHYLQDSYASGHLINKTIIMQWFIEWLNTTHWDDHLNEEERKSATRMAKASGLASAGQYDKTAVGTRKITDSTGTQVDVTTARNPQAVENTFGQAGMEWQQRAAMLGMSGGDLEPGKPAARVLTALQGRATKNKWFERGDSRKSTSSEMMQDTLLAGGVVAQALRVLAAKGIIELDGNRGIAYWQSLPAADTSAPPAGTMIRVTTPWRLDPDLKGRAPAQIAKDGSDISMAEGDLRTQYRDYDTFMNSAYLQKATNDLHDIYCKQGLTVAADTGAFFKVYGDNAMLESGSSDGVEQSTETAHLSRDSISDVAGGGQPRASTQDILKRLPSKVIAKDAKGVTLPQQSIEDWVYGGDLKNFTVKNVFEKVNPIRGFVGMTGTLGQITQDHDTF